MTNPDRRPLDYAERSAWIIAALARYPDLSGEWARATGAKVITGFVIDVKEITP